MLKKWKKIIIIIGVGFFFFFFFPPFKSASPNRFDYSPTIWRAYNVLFRWEGLKEDWWLLKSGMKRRGARALSHFSPPTLWSRDRSASDRFISFKRWARKTSGSTIVDPLSFPTLFTIPACSKYYCQPRILYLHLLSCCLPSAPLSQVIFFSKESGLEIFTLRRKQFFF